MSSDSIDNVLENIDLMSCGPIFHQLNVVENAINDRREIISEDRGLRRFTIEPMYVPALGALKFKIATLKLSKPVFLIF